MLRVLSEEEALKSRKRAFAKIKQGSLFNFGGEKYFIAVTEISKKECEVIELTEKNKKNIILENECEHSNLHFDQMVALNVR